MLRLARISLVGFIAVALQVSVAAQVPIAGAMVDVVLIATIGAGLAAGAEAGAGIGFACGLLIDMLGVGPVGLTALVYTLVGYAVGRSQTGVVRSSRLFPLTASVVAAVVAVFAYALVGEVLGQQVFAMVDIVGVAIVVTVSSALLCLPARSLMGWAFADDRRPQMRGIARW